MLKNGKKGSTRLKLILLSLMLTVQNLSFAHELSHYQAAETEYCSICSGQPGNEALVQADIAGQVMRLPLYPAFGQDAEFAGKHRWPDSHSRAPPVHP